MKKGEAAPETRRKAKAQLTLFELTEEPDEEGTTWQGNFDQVGKTVLDRLHQSMLLFGTGRSEALRRFLVEEGIGQDQRFWQLVQSMSALYPPQTEEKRWVDGVLARKKGLGF
ncbi:hypothetical protein WDW89_03720 [Deltaproteobacteria bacterium TL4]